MTGPERYLGVDFGAKRIGLAVGDSEAKLASPLTTVELSGLIAKIEAEGPFKTIIVGLPRNLDGQDTPQTLAVRRFADSTLGAFDVVFQDEAATSEIAKAELEATGKPYAREEIDAHAAAIILQDFLDQI